MDTHNIYIYNLLRSRTRRYYRSRTHSSTWLALAAVAFALTVFVYTQYSHAIALASLTRSRTRRDLHSCICNSLHSSCTHTLHLQLNSQQHIVRRHLPGGFPRTPPRTCVAHVTSAHHRLSAGTLPALVTRGGSPVAGPPWSFLLRGGREPFSPPPARSS